VSAEKSIASQEKQLTQLPPEFKAVAEWCWGDLRALLTKWCTALGMEPISAEVTASRVAKMVGAQIVRDVLDARKWKRP